MRIAQLNRRLTLQAPASVDDGAGGRDVTWTPVDAMWANVAVISGRESTDSEAITSRLTHRITIRYRTGIGPHMRFTDGTRIYRIETVEEPGGHRRWLVCRCSQSPAL